MPPRAHVPEVEDAMRALGIGRLFHVIRDAVIVANESGSIVLWNPAAARLFGWESEEIVGRSLETLVPPEYRARHRAGFARWRREGTGPLLEDPHPLALPALRKDGTRIHIELTLASLEDDEGRPHALAVVRDVTDRHELQEALQASERLSRQFLESLPVAVLVRSRDGRAVFLNGHARNLLDAENSPAVGVFEGAWRFYFRGTDTPYPVERLPIRRALEGAEDTATDEIEIWLPDGRRIPIEAWARPIRNDDGEVVYALVAFRDVSDRVRLQEGLARQRRELEAKNRELSDANQALEAFSYGVSHDLKEPLRALDAYGRALEEDYAGVMPGDAGDLIRRSRKAAARMERLIVGLLEFARATRGKLSVVPVDVAEALAAEACTARYGHLVAERGARIEADLAGVRVLATQASLCQVLGNLVTNAIRHNNLAEPIVRVRAEPVKDGQREIVIEDNGPGFPPSIAAAYPREGPPAALQPGRGFGLAIASRTVSRLGGRLWVGRGPNGGGSAHFVLPAADEPEAGQ